MKLQCPNAHSAQILKARIIIIFYHLPLLRSAVISYNVQCIESNSDRKSLGQDKGGAAKEYCYCVSPRRHLSRNKKKQPGQTCWYLSFSFNWSKTNIYVVWSQSCQLSQLFIQSLKNLLKKMGSPTYNHTAHAVHRKSHPLLLPAKLQSPISPIPFVYRVENTSIAEWLTWKLLDYQGNTQFRQVLLDYTLQLRCRVPQSTCKCLCQGNTAPLYRKYWLKTQELSKSVMDLAGSDISILLNG